MPSLTPFWRAIALSAILIMPVACAKHSPGGFCLIYQPVYSSPKDTAETLKQIDGNNAAWLELCRAGRI